MKRCLSSHGTRLAVLAAGIVLTLSACGGSGDENPPAPAAKPSVAAAKGGDETAKLIKGMVSAVSTGEAGSGVDLKFDLKSRPEAGQPFKIDFAFLPNRPSEVMRATFIAAPGLTIQPSAQAPEFAQVEAASVYRHELTVVAQQNGVFSVSAIVQIDSPAGPEVRTFTVPVVVGPPA